MSDAALKWRPADETSRVLEQLEQIILGKSGQLKLCLACILARGHLLIEDIPGVGKTTLAHALAHTLGLTYQRIQFTSDLLPADIVGVSIYERQHDRFQFHRGPIFAQLVLADEVNRATPKAQSALLEAMEERQITADGVTHDLPEPFFVVATQNPTWQIGTFPLPESQLDRFLMRISLGYPQPDLERKLLAGRDRRELLRELSPALDPQTATRVLRDLQEAATQMHVAPALLDYVQALVAFTRDSAAFHAGLSPRAAIALLRAAQAWALIAGHRGVLPEDVQAITPGIVGHRLKPRGDAGPQQPDEIGRFVLESVPVS
ncbi:AAA family ATPase [soil metagenome]